MADLIEFDYEEPEGTDADSEYEPIVLRIPFKGKDGKIGHEDFTCRPEIPFGVLIDLESAQSSAGIQEFLNTALLDDDGELDADGEPVEDTSSLDRYDALVHVPARKVPGPLLGKVFNGLYEEYGRRHGSGEANRPTRRAVRSQARPRRTGSTSTAKPSPRALTSARSRQAAG